ncbi:putative glycoside hydrolase [Candidatus Parcubacteria bacterium]|nr:putative glycoside hydrolase [Candidatus Parcubacteria bacterium]
MSARRNKKKGNVSSYRMGIGLFLLFIFASIFLYVGMPELGTETYDNGLSKAATVALAPTRAATHVPTPAHVKTIYMTSCVASSQTLRSNLVKLIDETEVNSVVIDIKSFDGRLSFVPADEKLQSAAGGCLVRDMQDFIDELHSHHIYVIGREASFQDQLMVKLRPDLAVKKESATTTVWKDYKGISWIDASSREHWEYLVAIAKAAHDIGFDEINFDYIRFPADGNMKDIWYPLSGKRSKSAIIRSFFEYLHDHLAPQGITTSADLFGMTTTNIDDLNIGQILEYALPNFDFVAPMVYPSHYPNGFYGLGDPNEHVYDVVKISLDKAVMRALAPVTVEEIPGARIGTSTPAIYAKPSWTAAKIRPWLQDNNYPVPYTADMVKAQIKAAADAGVMSWGLWNAGNRYTRAALETERID